MDLLRGGPLLPDLFPWMPVMPYFLLPRDPFLFVLGHCLTFHVYCSNYWVEEIYMPPALFALPYKLEYC